MRHASGSQLNPDARKKNGGAFCRPLVQDVCISIGPQKKKQLSVERNSEPTDSFGSLLRKIIVVLPVFGSPTEAIYQLDYLGRILSGKARTIVKKIATTPSHNARVSDKRMNAGIATDSADFTPV